MSVTELIDDRDSASKNTIYPFMDIEPVARYCKTVVYMVGGQRLNPENPKVTDQFILQSLDDGVQTKWVFRYQDDVIELYSEAELRHFKRMNAKAINSGLLVPYDVAYEGQPLPFGEFSVGDLD